jgi:osmotically-inducible protein OsmY
MPIWHFLQQELDMNKQNRNALLMAIAMGCVVALPAQAQKADSPSAQPAQGTNSPVEAQGDGRQQTIDQATTTRVKSALQLDSELKTQTILVDTVNGSVRLTGQVSSAANFERAKDLVVKLEGVKGVENLLVVKAVKPE